MELSQFVCSFDTTIASTVWLCKKAELIHLYSHWASMSACYPNMKRQPAHHPDCLLNSALMDRLSDVDLSHQVSWAASQHSYIAQEDPCGLPLPLHVVHSSIPAIIFWSVYHWPVTASLWSRQKWGCHCHFKDKDTEAQRGWGFTTLDPLHKKLWPEFVLSWARDVLYWFFPVYAQRLTGQ